jgi:hypothetical protein
VLGIIGDDPNLASPSLNNEAGLVRRRPAEVTCRLTARPPSFIHIHYRHPAERNGLARLETIAELSGNITVTGNNGGPFTISFVNVLAGDNVPLLEGSGTAGTLPKFETVRHGGTAFPALAGKVSVFGNPGGPFEIVFDNNNLPAPNSGFSQLQFNKALPTIRATVSGNERQRVSFTGSPAGGNFLLGYTPTGAASPTLTTTVAFAGSGTALSIQLALEDMFDVPAGTIQVTAQPNGADFDIAYSGLLGNANLGNLTAGNISLSPGASVSASTILDGGGNSVQTLVFRR